MREHRQTRGVAVRGALRPLLFGIVLGIFGLGRFGIAPLAHAAIDTPASMVSDRNSAVPQTASSVSVPEPPPLLRWPLQGEIVAYFSAEHPYGPGHRGIDITSAPGAIVKSAHQGTVTFAGEVAGVRSITVRDPSGWATSYSYVGAIWVEQGVEVRRGAPLATPGNLHGKGTWGIHFSLRIEQRYVDPLPYTIGFSPVLLPPPSDSSPPKKSVAEPSHTPGASPLFGVSPSADDYKASSRRGDGMRIARGCSVLLVDCGGSVGSALQRGSSLIAEVLERSKRLGDRLLGQAAVVADFATRADHAMASAIRLAIRDASETLAVWLASLASIPISTATQAALVFDPLNPQIAEKIRRRGQDRSAELQSKIRTRLNNLFDESLKPAALAVALEEQAAALARYGAERAKRGSECVPLATSQETFQEPRRRTAVTPPKRNMPSRDDYEDPNDFVYVAISGLGSSSSGSGVPVDLAEALRAKGHKVIHFSYAGFDVSADGTVVPRPYGPSDTYQDIRVSAEILASQIEAVKKANPNRKIIVVGHSQGGIVARAALRELEAREWKGEAATRVDALVTIATPNRGSGGAADFLRAFSSEKGRYVLASASGWGLPPLDSKSLSQLAWGSQFMRELGSRAPDNVPTTSISASTDIVVPAYETLVDGGNNVIFHTGANGVDAHSEIATDPRTIAAIEAAASNRTVCQSPEEIAQATSESALTTVGLERTRDILVDSLLELG
ncbi:MAG: hypothetical protein C4317_03475 [Acidimicrobiia bacterium]